MPFWLTLLGYAVKALMWYYGDEAHPAIVSKVMKYTPLTPEENPAPWTSNDSNKKNNW